MSSIDEKQTTKDYKEIPGKTVDKDALTSYEPSSYWNIYFVFKKMKIQHPCMWSASESN